MKWPKDQIAQKLCHKHPFYMRNYQTFAKIVLKTKQELGPAISPIAVMQKVPGMQ